MKISEKDAQVLRNIVKHCDAIVDTFCVALLLENGYKLIKLEFVAKRENVKE